MGCLKSIISKIVFLVLLFAFFYYGGVGFVSGLINDFRNPKREDAIKGALLFGDFSNVESDYKIGRTIGTFSSKKLTVEHKPSGQKIIFIEIPSDKNFTKADINTKVVDEKIQNFIKENDIKWMDIEEIKTEENGQKVFGGAVFDYMTLDFRAHIPFKKEYKGYILIYNLKKTDKKTKKPKTAVVLSLRNEDKFSKKIVDDMLNSVNFSK